MHSVKCLIKLISYVELFYRGGMKMTKEEKCSVTQQNRIVIHKGDKEKRIYLDQLPSYENDGWIRGQSKSHKKNNGEANRKGGKHKGNQNGFKKGQHSWNYGEKVEDHPKLQAALDKAHKASSAKGPWNKGLTAKEAPILGIAVSKAWLTKKKNGTCNTSKPEELLYEKLLKENESKTIYRNYKCERYPYHCDFYIVEDDLFIELNAHWTHGGRPFDPNDHSCQKQLELWREKAKTSKYWASAIETWTIKDVEKAECAKRNNLNYWVIY